MIGGYRGGYDSRAFDPENQEWDSGPGLPPGIGGYRSGAVLQVEDTFLLVRGSDDFVKLYEGV